MRPSYYEGLVHSKGKKVDPKDLKEIVKNQVCC